MYGLTVALTIIVATMCVDAYPTYQAWDMREMPEEVMNKPTGCQSDVSKPNKNYHPKYHIKYFSKIFCNT
jgi:hypothetical protein